MKTLKDFVMKYGSVRHAVEAYLKADPEEAREFEQVILLCASDYRDLILALLRRT